MEHKHTYKLTIAYDGSGYVGWQVQPNGVSIQEKLQEAVAIITRETNGVTGSGRTDAGVHALGQVAHLHTSSPLDCNKFRASMNGLLPPEIRVLDIEEVDNTFHSRYSAIGKVYHYHLYLDRVLLPFHRPYVWHIRETFSRDILRQAAQLFLGTHDFTSFANEAHAGSAARNPVRTINRLDVVDEEHGVRLEFEGDGFLYKMVRNIVGTLHEAAIGKLPLSEIAEIIDAKDRRCASKAAPPQGLFLVAVHYPK
ncbi:MAG: tRNA pseudouridine(38-40) synthase TruA [Chlamydiales bacterium]|nr:tRNA pseudouridine(38-40) synthase TruA [Chlamydiia bacterium]MCP5508560.1 tRNA pseudouridine(38-40) synthase TruA [Chlamydiales bacterium]